MNTPHLRSPELLFPARAGVLIVDVQERLLPHIPGGAELTAACVKLLHGAALFELPVTVTEQYPKGLGSTIPEVAAVLSGLPGLTRAEKLRFSAAGSIPAAGDREDGRDQVLLAGIETHVCILQTAFDLLARGYRVHLACDATGSRRERDRDIAVQRLRDSGVIVTTVEAALFELCESAESPRFRQLRDLVK